MGKKIVLSEGAYYDIDSIFSYISTENREAAEKLRLRLYDGISKLADFPEMGPVIREEDAPGAKRGHRRITINPYLVFYKVVEEMKAG